MKTLKEVMLGGYAPKSPDEKKFAAKHTVNKTGDVARNGDKLYKASNIKAVNRESPDNHGYNPGTDEKVYEENDALRKKWIKGRAKRETFKSGQKVKKSIARDIASKSKDSEKTVKESAFSKQYERGDSASRLPERQKPVKAPSIGSRVKSAIKAVDKAVTGLSGKKSVTPFNGVTPMRHKNAASFKIKEDTTMTEIPSHIARAVRQISIDMKDRTIAEEIDTNNLPMHTGTGQAPNPKLHHIVLSKPEKVGNGKMSHRVLSSMTTASNPQQELKKWKDSGEDVILVPAKKG